VREAFYAVRGLRACAGSAMPAAHTGVCGTVVHAVFIMAAPVGKTVAGAVESAVSVGGTLGTVVGGGAVVTEIVASVVVVGSCACSTAIASVAGAVW